MEEVERLYAWDVPALELAAARERLQRHPRYPAAARRLAANMLADAAADPVLGDLLRDAGRTVAALCVIGLCASGDLTQSRLKDSLAGFGLVSPGRGRGLLNLMLHYKYLQPVPGARPPRYAVAPQFLASYRRHETSLVDAVAILEPAARLVLANLGTPAVLNRLAIEQTAAFVAGSRQGHGFDAWYRIFMHRLAGIQLLHGLVAEADAFPPVGYLPFSAARNARRFQVSRVHVSRMIHEAENAGFVEAKPGALRFTEAGREALDWLYASRLCVHLACIARVLKTQPEFGGRELQPVARVGI